MSDKDVDYRALFEAAPDKYLVLSPTLTILTASEAYLRATMTQRDAIVGRGLFEVFPDNPDDPSATGVRTLRASLERVLRTHAPDTMAVQKYDVRRPDAEGGGFEERFWSPINTPVLSSSGALRFIVHRVEDVTDFMRMKKAASKQGQPDPTAVEAEIYRRAQELQTINEHIRELNDALAQRVEASTQDLRAAAAQLQQAQKMEAVGQLAGGIAHDFNNMLSVILTYAELTKDMVPAVSEAYTCVDQIERAALRSASLTRKLLAFSRQQVTRPSVLDLNAVVRELQEMLQRVVSEAVRIELHLHVGIGSIRVDRGHLEQALMNLVVNARDALPDGGTIKIETGQVHLRDDARPGRDVVAGPYVTLTVQDDGIGMSPETLARVFDPFFTTKEMGHGTGLGLAMVHGIVTQAGGFIDASSTPGKGTVFTLHLPQLSAKPHSTTTRSEVGELPRGNECVLLVEDEPLVADAASAALRERGYRVVLAANGHDALSIAQREGQALALLLTDVIMPGMKGPELAGKLQALVPKLRVLYMSGYTEHLMSRIGDAAFMEKPFTPESLARKVRETLDAP